MNANREPVASNKEQRQRELSDLLQVLELPAGRRAIWRLLEASSPMRNPFTGGRPEDTAYNCGRIALGQVLMANLLSPQLIDQYVLMQKEHSETAL